MEKSQGTLIKIAGNGSYFDPSVLSRVLPFAVFMFFIAIEEGFRVAGNYGCPHLPDATLYYLYPMKTAAVAALLFKYRDRYTELQLRDLRSWKISGAVCATGVITFVLWVAMDWVVSVTGAPKGFNPALLPEGTVRVVMTSTRVVGAVLVVPVMEEIFWRSFLLRYLIDQEFESVRLGRFSWTSFLVTTLLFGLEHHLVVAGMVAGAIYNVILYKTRSLAQCVLAHAVTNLALACYVLYTGKWYFW